MSTPSLQRFSSTSASLLTVACFVVILSGCTTGTPSPSPDTGAHYKSEKDVTSNQEITDVIYNITLDCPEGWLCEQKNPEFGAHLNAPDALVNVFVSNAFRSKETPAATHAAEVEARSISTEYFARSVSATGEMNNGLYSVVEGRNPATNEIRETTFIYTKTLGEKQMACIGNVAGEPFQKYEAEIRFACSSMRTAIE